jgi:hypothetical protein
VLSILARERKRRAGEADDAADDDERPSSTRVPATFSPWNALPVVSAQSVGRTVPVPPPAEGGVIGSLVATVVLGFEVMVALVTGPVFYVLRAVGRGVDRTMRSVPGVLGSTLRLGLFLLLLSLLGAAVSLVALLLFLD